MEKLTQEQVEIWVRNEPDEFDVERFRIKHNIDSDSDTFYKAMSRLVEKQKLKRLRRGWYRKVTLIEPIKWWNGDEVNGLEIVWPYGVDDDSSFEFDDTIEVFPNDTLVVAGTSNWGKTTFALNFLVHNLHLFEGALLMVNEYKPERFRDRMKRFTWIDYWDEDKPKFETLPVIENHIDYIKPTYLNAIDWLHITGDFWKVGKQIEEMQMPLRGGLNFIVLQKTSFKEFGSGGEWGEFFPSVYLTLDAPGVLTVKKVKSAPKGKVKPEGKRFAYDIIEGGSRFHNIREIKVCNQCWGKKLWKGEECDRCIGRGFIDK